MQTNDDLLSNPSLADHSSHLLALPTMSDAALSPIRSSEPSSPRLADETGTAQNAESTYNNGGTGIESKDRENGENVGSSNKASSEKNSRSGKKETNDNMMLRRVRPSRACTVRSAKLYVDPPVIVRKPRPPKKEKAVAFVEVEVQGEEEDQGGIKGQNDKVVTELVNPPSPEQLSRWNLRSMWELASILNFLNVFRPLLKITSEFSAEELESALITFNHTLSDVHIPLLKAIPPVTRTACGRDTWVTVLCRKLRDWWHWVADGEVPIVTAQGAEIDHYKSVEPSVRVIILKALCDIRVQQDDIRSFIDDSMKRGIHLSTFRKERIGGNSHGISYWYEDDTVVGHRLYREIRKVAVKRVKAKGSLVNPTAKYQWETVATNFDEFQEVSEKLCTSKNRTEFSLGKRLKNEVLPEIEKVQKKKEKLLKKQQREALLLDNFGTTDGLGAGRSLRDRKRVTYTFDDYDRSINAAIKITKQKQPFSEVDNTKPEGMARYDPSTNGTSHVPSDGSQDNISFSPLSPSDHDDMDEKTKPQYSLDRSNRRRRPGRYSEEEFVEAMSDDEDEDEGDGDGDSDYFDSDEDIVGEVVYDEDYVRKRKRTKKQSSSSEAEGDEEYKWSDENGEEEEDDDDEEDENESVRMSDDEEDSDERPRRRFRKLPGRTRGELKTKLRPVSDLQSGLRRSRRSTRNRINYQQYELSASDPESSKSKGPAPRYESGSHSDSSENEEYLMDTENEVEEISSLNVDEVEEVSSVNVDEEVEEVRGDQVVTGEDGCPVAMEKQVHIDPKESKNIDEDHGVERERHFLDLNELAPGSGFDDGPCAMKDEEDNKGGEN